jgi:hypothetical protein
VGPIKRQRANHCYFTRTFAVALLPHWLLAHCTVFNVNEPPWYERTAEFGMNEPCIPCIWREHSTFKPLTVGLGVGDAVGGFVGGPVGCEVGATVLSHQASLSVVCNQASLSSAIDLRPDTTPMCEWNLQTNALTTILVHLPERPWRVR